MLAVLIPTRLSVDDRLCAMIEEVRRNEALYEQLDVRMRMQYEIGDRAPTKLASGYETTRKDVDTHFVSQGGMFRLQTKGGGSGTGGTTSRNKSRLFDAEKTRLLDRDLLANGDPEQEELLRFRSIG